MAIINIFCGNDFMPQGFCFAAYEPEGSVSTAPADTITFTDSVTVVTDYHQVSDFFSPYHDAVVELVINRSVGNFVEFSQELSRATFISVTDYLQMSHAARTVLHETAVSIFTISQSLDYTRGMSQTITLSQAVVVQIVKKQVIAQTITFTQGVGIYKQNDPTFSPPVPDPAFQPVVLVYSPYSITLVVPEIGDEDKIEHQRISRKNRGGETIIYHDPQWPVTEVLSFEFQNLTQAQVKNLLAFVQITLGRTITLTDHNNVDWEGIIVNPNLEATCIREIGCGAFTVPLEFEGSRV